MGTVTFRSDPEVDQALVELTADGTSQSAAIRAAVLAEHRRRLAERLRAETAALAADPQDRAEVRAIQSELESLRAW